MLENILFFLIIILSFFLGIYCALNPTTQNNKKKVVVKTTHPTKENINENEQDSLLTKIDKSSSLTDFYCDCDDADEIEVIKAKMHKQDAKFNFNN